MAEIILDMSGVGGLAPGHAGDTDQITPVPSRNMRGQNGQMVSGLFNPHLRQGYLSPTTTTSVEITHGTTPASELVAVEYNDSSGEVILLDNTNGIYKLSSLTDTSTELVELLDETNDFGSFAYEELYDAQIYLRNGSPRLYVVGKSLPYGGELVDIGTTTGSSSVVTSFAINPSSTTQPSVVYDTRSFVASAGTSEDLSVTVPSGTNTCLFFVCFFSSTANPANVYSFGDSVYMTELGEAGTGGGPGFFAAYLPNPTAGTYNLQFAVSGGTLNNLTMMAFVTDETDQTDPVSFNGSKVSTPTISEVVDYVNSLQLGVLAAYSSGTITLDNGLGEISSDTQAYGSDLLAQKTEVSGSGLMIGSLVLPLSSNGAAYHTWSASTASGAFFQELDGDFAFMRSADNGFAYVFADNTVHKIDGNTTGGEEGTITRNVLLFPEGFTITDAVDYRSNLYIAIHQYPTTIKTTSLSNYRGKCGVYVWDRISVQLSKADYIELPGVREIKKIFASPDGVLKLITISASGVTELRQFGYNDSGGVVFPVVAELGIGAYPQVPDGLATAGDKTLWLANNGYMYGEKGNAVVKLYEAETPGATTVTLAENITSGVLFFGSGSETASSGYRSNKQGVLLSYDGATTVTEKVYPFDLTTGANAAQTPHEGSVYTPVKIIPITSLVRRIRIYNAPVSSTGTGVIATVKVYFNQHSTADITKSITLNEAKRGYVDFNISKPYVHAVQLEVEWATGTPIGDDMYMPSIAVISTEETEMVTPDSE